MLFPRYGSGNAGETDPRSVAGAARLGKRMGEARSGKARKAMDERIEAFLKDVLALEGEDPSVIREGVRAHLVAYEKLFRDAETKRRMKDGGSCRPHAMPRARG
jgi:hypothetical protein